MSKLRAPDSPRRWSTLLCREMPKVRHGDDTRLIQPDVTEGCGLGLLNTGSPFSCLASGAHPGRMRSYSNKACCPWDYSRMTQFGTACHARTTTLTFVSSHAEPRAHNQRALKKPPAGSKPAGGWRSVTTMGTKGLSCQRPGRQNIHVECVTLAGKEAVVAYDRDHRRVVCAKLEGWDAHRDFRTRLKGLA